MCFSQNQVCGILIRNESNEFIYICYQCEFNYLTSNDLEAHILLEHRNDVEEKPSPIESATVELEIQPIAVEMPSPSETIHKKPIQKPKAAKAKRQRFYCDICHGKWFNTFIRLKQHMQFHIGSKKYRKCSFCKKRVFNLERHQKTWHGIEEPYKCDYCDAAFKTSRSQLIHIRSHTGEHPYHCTDCDKAYKSETSLYHHNMRIHTKQLPHPCEYCERTFMTPSELEQHTFSFHLNIRPHACDLCAAEFPSIAQLKAHKQTHGQRKYSCQYCSKKFKTIPTKRWHERQIHEMTSQYLEIEFV